MSSHGAVRVSLLGKLPAAGYTRGALVGGSSGALVGIGFKSRW